jgi:hypothetical protein
MKQDGAVCGERLHYIASTRTLDADLLALTGVDPKLVPHYTRSSRVQLPAAAGAGAGASSDAEAALLPVPRVTAQWMPALCHLYRDDFCCLGYSVPPACHGLCRLDALPRRALGLGGKRKSWLHQPYSKVGIAAEVAALVAAAPLGIQLGGKGK